MAIAAAPPVTDEGPCQPVRRGWTRQEFERFIDLGVFGPEERLELIGGEIIQKMTQKEPHATSTTLVGDGLRVVFAAGRHVRVQLPLSLGEHDRPEPDIAVVVGAPRDYLASHPTAAVLVVEISDTTLGYDRMVKAGVYARAGIAEYWIVNLIDRLLEVHRQPAPMAEQPLGHGYRSIARLTEAEAVVPLGAPQSPVAVADLLP